MSDGEEYPPSKATDLAMQPRCLGCLREHWALHVIPVSIGEARCGCGYLSEPMTQGEYEQRMRARRSRDGPHPVQ